MSVLGLETWHLLLTFLAGLPLIYWYLTRNFNYWSKRGLKSPKPIIGFGNVLYGAFTPIPTLELKWYKKYGKLYGIYRGNEPILIVGDPELIKQILVKDFSNFFNRQKLNTEHAILDKNLVRARGDDWKRIRSIASPTFTSGKMKKMFPSIQECVDSFIEHLESCAKDGQEIDLKDKHGRFTMDVIAKCAFATQTNAHKDPNNPLFLNGMKVFEVKFYKMIPLLIFPKFLNKLLNIDTASDGTGRQFFLDLCRHIMKTRRNDKTKHNDFIQLLMDAEKDKESLRDEQDVNEAHHVNEGDEELKAEKNALNINLNDKRLTEDEILAQAVVFFVAGYETTATTLSFCSYELALNPECQETLYQEISSAVDSKGELSYEKVAKLPYLDAVVSETLRLYSPAIRLQRESANEYKLGDTGITLYKGQIVEIPIFAIHHSEEYYENPEKFNPERFLPENRDQIVPYTYLPFGAGPRNCIGMRFALMEAKLCLAQIVRRFRFVKSPKTEVPLRFKTLSFLTAARSIIVGIEKRQ